MRTPSCCASLDERRRARIAPVAQLAAQVRGAAQQQDIGAAPRRADGSRKSRDTRADHEHIGADRDVFVAIRIRLRGCAAKAGQAPNARLIHMPIGPFEGFVIKAGGQECGKPIVDRGNVEAHAGPAIHAFRGQTLLNFQQAGAHIRRAPRTRPHIHKTRRFFDAAAVDPARPMQFDAASDELHAVRQQRRGQRIAMKPGVAPLVECKADLARAIEPRAAGGGQSARAHGGRSCMP